METLRSELRSNLVVPNRWVASQLGVTDLHIEVGGKIKHSYFKEKYWIRVGWSHWSGLCPVAVSAVVLQLSSAQPRSGPRSAILAIAPSLLFPLKLPCPRSPCTVFRGL